MARDDEMTDYIEGGHLEEPEIALVEGYLRDVDPKLGTAEIRAHLNSIVSLRFDSSLNHKMLRLETKYVKVKGQGWINESDEWIAVKVEEITCPVDKPFDPDDFYNSSAPKIFDPDKIVRAKEPFNVDQFLREIYEARGRQYP